LKERDGEREREREGRRGKEREGERNCTGKTGDLV
jgi:hypothetical protein